jgi:hypothetical protein
VNDQLRSRQLVICHSNDATLGVASDAVRDQVIRHDPFKGVFNRAYINRNVRFNVQDTFLESDISDDRLTRAFTYMSI